MSDDEEMFEFIPRSGEVVEDDEDDLGLPPLRPVPVRLQVRPVDGGMVLLGVSDFVEEESPVVESRPAMKCSR